MKFSALTLSEGLPGRPRADETMFGQSSRFQPVAQLDTVAAYHLPPVALAILRRFSSAAALCADKPASWANTAACARPGRQLPWRCALIPPSSRRAHTPPVGRGEAFPGPLRNERPLLLRQRGE